MTCPGTSLRAMRREPREPKGWARAALGDLTFWQVLLPPLAEPSTQDSCVCLSPAHPGAGLGAAPP